MRRIFILLFLLLSGCASIKFNAEPLRPDPLMLYHLSVTMEPAHQCSLPVFYAIHEDISDELEQQIIRSFEYWDDLTDKNLFFYLGRIKEVKNPDLIESDIIIVEKLNEDKQLAITEIQWNTITHCIFKTTISIPKETLHLPKSAIEAIIRHEIGHVLGFDHSNIKRDLMYPQYDTEKGELKGLSNWELKSFQLMYE